MSMSHALIDDMGVHNVAFLIDSLGADAAPLQYIRELTQNEIESITRAGREKGLIEIDYEEVDGVRKLRISGNGEGMTPDEVADNINRLSASGGVQAFDKNFGIGAKITAGTRNPNGVMYKAWKQGAGSLTVLGASDGRYGRLGFPGDDDTVDYWVPLPAEDAHPVMGEGSGVSVVLLGRTPDEDTTVAPLGADLPSQWVSAYLERRYFDFPTDITIRVLRPVEIYDSERDEHRAIYDTIRGQGYYLDKHSESSGKLDLPQAKSTVWWWLLSDEITKGGKTWNNRGHVAALYQNELYEIRWGAARTSALKDFGIYAGYGRIVVYVEPHNVMKANTARTSLILEGSEPIDYVDVGGLFSESMPDELASFMAGQVTSEQGDHRKAIRKNIREVEEALDHARYRRSRRGRPDHFVPEDGGRVGSSIDQRPRSDRGSGRSREDATGRVGTEYLRRAREEQERRMKGEKVETDPTPKIVWDHDGSNVPSGRAATYTPQQHVVTASATFGFFLDMVEWALDEARSRAPSDMGDEALRGITEDEVKRWFEQALSEAVVVLRPLSHDAEWGPKIYETGLGDDGLTAAVVSHRWHMMSAIKRGLAGRLGRTKEAAAS